VTKYLREINLKKERFISGLWFQRLQSMVIWPQHFWTCDKAEHLVKGHVRRKLLDLWQLGGKKKEERGQGQNLPYEGMPPMDLFP
jgi:hypothetical protein